MLEMPGEPQVFQAGTLLAGRYEVVRSVGSGGMGWVVQVIDRALDSKSRALKMLYPHLVKDERVFARFRNEVTVAQDLSHPNIVRIHDLGVTEQGQYFISMEYVHGASLKEVLASAERQQIPFEDVLRILFEIAQGVAYAHSKGIIHRDLKPDNVLISKLGEVKIVDFGIARSFWQDQGLTKTGGAVGTPYYMSPEQIRGQQLDPRCDIYSLGIMAYELAVGRRPFDDECFYNLAQQHISEEIAPCSKVKPGVPKWFDEFVAKAAAKDPDDRFASMDELAAALAPFIGATEKLRTKTRALSASAIRVFEASPPRRLRLPAFSMSVVGWMFLIMVILFSGCLTLRSNDSWKAAIGSAYLLFEDYTGIPLGALKRFSAIAISDGGTEDLLRAIARNNKWYVRLIVSAKRPLNQQLEDGSYPIHRAVMAPDRELFREFLVGNPELDVLDRQGRSALALAVSKSRADQALMLLNQGADPNIGKVDGGYPVHWALWNGHPDILFAVFEKNVDPGLKDDDGHTPLHLAALAGRLPQLTALLAKGGDVEARNNKGETPLFLAVRRRMWPAVEILLEHKASPSASSPAGKTILDILPSDVPDNIKRLLEERR